MSLEISRDEYQKFTQLLQKYSGILLDEGKEYLVVSRLRKLMQDKNLTSFTQLIGDAERNTQLRESVVDAMTTNETLWFRDKHPYRILREILLPEMVERRGGLKIWSAACSTGQEPYSIGIEIEHFKAANSGKLMGSEQIIATDISPSALDTAKKGVYQKLAIQRGMEDHHLERYFDKKDEETWAIQDNIKRKVSFRTQNLCDSFSSLGKFDIIFCRNVLIYFSSELKTDIIRRMHAQLNPKGYLILGASESLSGAADLFDMVQCSPGLIYRAKDI